MTYGRPGVNGRTIWGGLVPYDTVWRAGANENTVLSVNTPVIMATGSAGGPLWGFMVPTTTSGW